jgi:hypothetical protein
MVCGIISSVLSLNSRSTALSMTLYVTACHMYAAAAASAPDHGGSTSPISKDYAGGKQAMYI